MAHRLPCQRLLRHLPKLHQPCRTRRTRAIPIQYPAHLLHAVKPRLDLSQTLHPLKLRLIQALSCILVYPSSKKSSGRRKQRVATLTDTQPPEPQCPLHPPPLFPAHRPVANVPALPRELMSLQVDDASLHPRPVHVYAQPQTVVPQIGVSCGKLDDDGKVRVREGFDVLGGAVRLVRDVRSGILGAWCRRR